MKRACCGVDWTGLVRGAPGYYAGICNECDKRGCSACIGVSRRHGWFCSDACADVWEVRRALIRAADSYIDDETTPLSPASDLSVAEARRRGIVP